MASVNETPDSVENANVTPDSVENVNETPDSVENANVTPDSVENANVTPDSVENANESISKVNTRRELSNADFMKRMEPFVTIIDENILDYEILELTQRIKHEKASQSLIKNSVEFYDDDYFVQQRLFKTIFYTLKHRPDAITLKNRQREELCEVLHECLSTTNDIQLDLVESEEQYNRMLQRNKRKLNYLNGAPY